MTHLSHTKKIIITSLCVSLCIVLPIALHAIPNAGMVICPMHIPVLLCGLICGCRLGGICGLLGPVLSSLLTGMPPIAILPCMTAELVSYGIVSGFLMKILRTKNLYVDLFISLIIALIIGKGIAGILTALFFSPDGYSIAIWATSYLVIALPGIIIQLIIVPALYVALNSSKRLPIKYRKKDH